MNQAWLTVVRLVPDALGLVVLQASLVAAALLVLEHVRPRWHPELRAGLMLIALVKFAVPPWLAWVPPPPLGEPVAAIAARAMSAVPSAIPLALAAIWLAGSLVALGVWACARMRLARILAEAEPAVDMGILTTMDRAARRLGLARTPRLLLSERASAPWVTGVMRPTVVVPASWPSRLAADDLAMILAHEIAHVRRRDILVLELAAALATIWWWNPAFHAVRSRLRAILEEGCDECAITVAGGDPGSYCAALLRAARLAIGAPAPSAAPAGAVGMGAQGLERRLRRALARDGAPHGRTGALARAVLVVLGLALLPAIGRPALGISRTHAISKPTTQGHEHAAPRHHHVTKHRH